jgi:hypothetical protein
MKESFTRAERRQVFGIDPRTAMVRHKLQAFGVVITGTRTFPIYDATYIRSIATNQKTNTESK